MKKLTTKIMALAMCAACIIPAVGCGGRGDGEEVDSKKSQLYIGSWNGDFQLEWLKVMGKRFEETYADHSFEPGKTGVQVHVSEGTYVYDTFATTIANCTEEILVSEQCNYYTFVNKNTVMDITDVTTTPLTEYGETRSIADKLTTADQDYYGVTRDGSVKYYGLPWYETYTGFMYDLQLFEDENLYFAADGVGQNGFIVNSKTKKSNGPDGQEGTDDDGLPATYDEFFQLLDKMSELGFTPVIWGGGAQVYLNNLLSSLAADYEGYDDMMRNYLLEGEAEVVKEIKADGTIELETVEITNANGYELKRQAGYYYGLKFIERLLTTKGTNGSPKYYTADSTSDTFTHRAAQSNFIRGEYAQNVTTCGILIDATWWYSGARETFEGMSNIPGASANERRFGIMPMPKVDENHLGEATYFNNWVTSINIRKGIEESKVDMAKQFVRFMHTDVSLSEFTRLTGAVRPFNYELTAEDEAIASTFAKQNINIRKNAKVVNPWSTNALVQNNLSVFMRNDTMYTSIVGGNSYKLVSNAIRGGVSAKDYFNGLATYMSKNNWEKNFSAWF